VNRVIKAAGIAALAVATLVGAGQIDSATVTMGKGYDKGVGLGAGTMQDYYLLASDGGCHHRKSLANFSMLTPKSVTKPLPAGALVNIYAVVGRLTGPVARVCENNVSFTPIPSHHYSVLQRTAVGQSCQIEVIDSATNEAPVDLNQDNSLSCTKNGYLGYSRRPLHA